MSIIKTAPELQQKENQEEIPNPMLDSVDSGLSTQRKFTFKKLKLTLSGGKGVKRKEFYMPSFQVKQIQQKERPSYSPNVSKIVAKHKQIDYLFPLLKLVQTKMRNNGVVSECQNGEEVTISQKFYVSKSSGLLEIFQKTAHGYKLTFEEIETEQDKVSNSDDFVKEEIMKSSQARRTFQRATKTLQSIKLVSDAMKQVTEEEKNEEIRIKKDRQHSEQMNSLLKNQMFKSEHQLSEQIDLAKQNTIRWCIRKIKSTQINNGGYNQEEDEEQLKIKQVNDLIKSAKETSIILTYGLSILFVLFLLAYVKTLNNATTVVEDL